MHGLCDWRCTLPDERKDSFLIYHIATLREVDDNYSKNDRGHGSEDRYDGDGGVMDLSFDTVECGLNALQY